MMKGMKGSAGWKGGGVQAVQSPRSKLMEDAGGGGVQAVQSPHAKLMEDAGGGGRGG